MLRDAYADIVAELRNINGDMYDGTITTDEWEFHSYADRIETAANRERELTQPDPDWKAICEKCHDGDILPDCEYFGEPNGCNSPIYGEHPKAKPVGDAAAMREVVELLNQLFDSCVLGTHSEMTADEMGKVDELYFKTKAALAAPPRACDLFSSYSEAEDYWHENVECAEVNGCFDIWLFEPVAERKGENDGR